ncbi:CdaR family transcriptional regulator [Sediminibacillus halophilus]|uniref:Carbohydrate diacid regulator n=1 Tax=Sediminibacillus halophilus TaxID=482461 RepID=A0A1G9RW79_9BACI|nr:sugar diacid recognition domain-containing protein [Sediminibacillus halophilus]SDM27280.1 carbohydrate diacid regulator [Sediminibacillus halophilus]
MYLTPALGRKIVSEVKPLLDEHLIIVDPEGTIIASTDKDRIDNYHEGAVIACQRKTDLILSEADEANMIGVKAGINLPIYFEGVPIGVIGITGSPETVAPFGSLVKKMTELLIRENIYFQQAEWKTRRLEAYLFDWVQQEEPDEVFLNNGRLLGIDMSSWKRCTLIHFSASNNKNASELYRNTRDWLGKRTNDLVLSWGNDCCLLIHDERRSLETKVSDDYSCLLNRFQRDFKKRFGFLPEIAVGPPGPPERMSHLFQKTEKTLAIAIKRASLVLYEDLLLELCIEDLTPATKTAFIERCLGELPKYSNLLATLNVFLANNLQIAETARQLNVHINTIHYRLSKIETITGHDPKQLPSQVSFYLALLLLEDPTK